RVRVLHEPVRANRERVAHREVQADGPLDDRELRALRRALPLTASQSSTFSSPMAEALVRYEVVDGVGVISLNRPERHNAIDDETGAQWRARLDEAITDPAVRC